MDLDSTKRLILPFVGDLNVKPVDIANILPRHPTKKYKIRSESKIDLIVIHCTDRDWTIDQLAEYDTSGKLTYIRKYDNELVTDINHINKQGIPAITYHECIDDHQVWHTLPYTEITYNASGYNSISVAIAMMYRTTNPKTNQAEFAPPEGMLKLSQCRAAELCLKFGLTPDRVQGHRELKGTGWDWIKGRKRLLKTCPGPFIDLDLMRTNIATYMQIILKVKGLYNGEIDGDFGPLSKIALKGLI